VMAGGLDRPFPPENKPLWETFLAAGRAVFVSESGFGARASALTLRRRNKLIVALAQGVLVGQSSTSGGAMNAYRFGLEQHKPVTTFEPDGADDTSGNAVIANDARSGGSFFPVGSSAPDLYEAWLRPLSSST
jgi:predicted Rossmann fold nucleotide-binding protein DprA/Smf involved in DNA uptake